MLSNTVTQAQKPAKPPEKRAASHDVTLCGIPVTEAPWLPVGCDMLLHDGNRFAAFYKGKIISGRFP